LQFAVIGQCPLSKCGGSFGEDKSLLLKLEEIPVSVCLE